MFLRTLKRRLHRPRQRQIPLEQLARLWLDNPEPETKGGPEIVTHWMHKELNGFYSQYIHSFLPPANPARPVLIEILTLLDERGDCPSSIPEPGHESEDEVFAEISLLEYSLEVARIAHEMVMRGHRDPEMLMGKILIIALGHQLGVISEARTLGGIPAKSILLLEPLIRSLPYRESIVEAITTFRGNHPKSQEAKILKAASSAARKNQSERAKVFSKAWNQPSMDIEEIKKALKEEEG